MIGEERQREVRTQLLVARNGDCHREHVRSGRDGRGEDGLGSGRSRNVNDEGESLATVG